MNERAPGDGDDLLRNLDELLAGLEEQRRRHDGAGEGSGQGAGGDAARVDLELLGRLPLALDERAPSPELKERLLQAVRRQSAEAPAAAAAGASPEGAAPAGGVASLAAAREARDAAASPSPSPQAAPQVAFRPPAWLSTLAAALLLAMVGLAVFSGWLYAKLDDQAATIARLSDELHAATGEVEDLAATRVDLERGRRHLAARLALVATPGVEVCPLRPQGDQPRFPQARGLLFLSAPRDQWYVRVANVEPPPRGRSYHLWFVLGDEVMDAGVLRPGGDGTVELAGSGLPAEERMTAALVTLEAQDPAPARPAGPQILYGDEKMDMI